MASRIGNAPLALTIATLILTATCPGQSESGAEECLKWITSGKRPAQTSLNKLLTRAIGQGEGHQLARAISKVIEDTKKPAEARGRATDLAIGLLQVQDFRDYDAGLQQQVARALAHATHDPTISPRQRGFAIATTAQLTGRPERLMWLLEGQVQLRTLLNPRQEKGHPHDDVAAGILSYLNRLGEDALPSFDLLLELFRSNALPRNCEFNLLRTLHVLAQHNPEKHAPLLFTVIAKELGKRPLHDTMLRGNVLDRLTLPGSKVLKNPNVQTSITTMVQRLTKHLVESKLRATDQPSKRIKVILGLLSRTHQLVQKIEDPALESKLLKRAREHVGALIEHDNPALKSAGKTWLE